VVAPRAAQGAALLGRSGDALIAAVCAELAREGPAALTRADPWQRALEVR